MNAQIPKIFPRKINAHLAMDFFLSEIKFTYSKGIFSPNKNTFGQGFFFPLLKLNSQIPKGFSPKKIRFQRAFPPNKCTFSQGFFSPQKLNAQIPKGLFPKIKFTLNQGFFHPKLSTLIPRIFFPKNKYTF